MDENAVKGFSLTKGDGTRIRFRGTSMTIKVTAEQTNDAYAFIEMLHPPSVGPALHIHPRGPEAFYVLEGRYTIRSGDDRYAAGPGDFVFIPKGLPHSYQSGPEGGTVLVIAPAGLERYFSEVAKALTQGPLPWEIEQDIAKRHGQEFLEQFQHWAP